MDRQLQDEILTVARRLFIQHGYHGLSMRTIAEEVGVSKAALYYYYEDKQALFLAILKTSLLEIEALLDRCLASNDLAFDQVRQFVQLILQQPQETRAVIRLASQELGQLQEEMRQTFETEYQQRFLDKLDRLFAAGIVRGELREMAPRLLTWSLLGLLYPYFYPSFSRASAPNTQIANQICTIFFEGAAGRNLADK